jgi:hypothetical protein
MLRDARESRHAGTLLAIVVLIGETAGLCTCCVEIPFRSWGYILFEFYFLTDPPVLTDTLYIVNKQGVIDERSIDSVDETIDSKGNIAKVRTGG